MVENSLVLESLFPLGSTGTACPAADADDRGEGEGQQHHRTRYRRIHTGGQCVDGALGTPDFASFSPTVDTTVFIIVDAFAASDAGAYSLDWSIIAP